MKLALRVVALCALTAPAIAVAHPGHGGMEAHEPLHYLLDHPLLALGAIAVAGGLLLSWRRRRG